MADPVTDLDAFAWQTIVDLHRVLLALAGRWPDELVTEARRDLSVDLQYLPDLLLASPAAIGVPFTRAEVAAVRAFFIPGLDAEGLAGVPLVDEVPATGHRFTPVSPQLLDRAGDRIPPVLDLTGGEPDELIDLPPDLAHLDDLALDLTDSADGAVAVAMSDEPGTVGVWRAWRGGPGAGPGAGSGAGSGSARRVYLVEVDPGAPAWDVAYWAQRELADFDESPQVEVYWTGDDLPPYHRAALGHAALLWARTPGRVRLAAVGDHIDAAGRPVFGPDHPRMVGPERDRLLVKLGDGEPVGAAAPPSVDVVEPARGAVVPSGHRTDGRWAWPDAAEYYLDQYGLRPDPRLVEHLRTTLTPAVVDGPGLFRAAAAVSGGASGGPPAARAGGGSGGG